MKDNHSLPAGGVGGKRGGGKRSKRPHATMMTYSEKDLYLYADKIPALKSCIKETVLTELGLKGKSPEKEKAWRRTPVTATEVGIFKRSSLYAANKSRFDRFAERFSRAVEEIEHAARVRQIGRASAAGRRHGMIEAAQTIMAEIERQNIQPEYTLQGLSL